jgi:hypothetical protein
MFCFETSEVGEMRKMAQGLYNPTQLNPQFWSVFIIDSTCSNVAIVPQAEKV